MASIEKLQEGLNELTARAGKTVSVAVIAESFLKGTGAVVLVMQSLGTAPSELLRVQSAQAIDDPDGAGVAIVAHRGPVVIEIARAMPVKLINQLMDNEILRRDERAVFLIFEEEEWAGAREIFSVFGKAGYAVVGLDENVQ